MSRIIYQVDAFTRQAFSGNPAGVCVLPGPVEAGWMQNVAREMNLSETAFLHKIESGFSLRWFTPAAEMDLCGHATLASAHILWETGYLAADETAHFHTRSGLLTASHQGEWIEMNFPATREEPAVPPDDLLPALGVEAKYVGKNKFDYLVEVQSEAVVRSLQPDITRLGRIPVRGVIVTSRSDSPEFDFISRFFAPAVGVNEDPVTGSAHSCLGPYWCERLGKNELNAYQASPRGGVLRIGVRGDRVLICGQAVTVLKAELLA